MQYADPSEIAQMPIWRLTVHLIYIWPKRILLRKKNNSLHTKKSYTRDQVQDMSIRSRLQAPFHVPTENPNLVPLQPQGNLVRAPGRFQNVNVPNAAELRTQLRVPAGTTAVVSQPGATIETIENVPTTTATTATTTIPATASTTTLLPIAE